MRATHRGHLAAACAAAALAGGVAAPASALEFRSVGETAAVLYDAPSAKSKKLYIVNRGYPLEIVVVVEGWSKVRDAGGELSWIETRSLAAARTVMVKVPLAQVRDRADDGAPVAFQAQQSVILDLLEVAGAWLHVRHRDGQTGYVRVTQVWGA
ncbi:MAG TPA: SH3 domain-containing protein [Burkholderiales bacterium]|nr:SH3 domain-containing protein [Burkholderiales bacterium]